MRHFVCLKLLHSGSVEVSEDHKHSISPLGALESEIMEQAVICSPLTNNPGCITDCLTNLQQESGNKLPSHRRRTTGFYHCDVTGNSFALRDLKISAAGHRIRLPDPA